MFNRHMGYFEIPKEAFDHPAIIREIMDQVVIIEASYHVDTRSIHYLGIGECFKLVDISEMAPHYNISCDRSLTERPLIFVPGDGLLAQDWLANKLHNCLRCLDEKKVACRNCAGSGEGMADGAQCQHCKGSGEVGCPKCSE